MMRITDEDGKLQTDCKKCRHYNEKAVVLGEAPTGCGHCQYEQGVALHYVFHLGKHKGKTVSQVISEDPQYLLWMTANVKWFELSPAAKFDLLKACEGYDKKMYAAEVRREIKFPKEETHGENL